MDPDTIYDVFLCHATKDKLAVEGLARRLKRNRIRPFLDKWHLVPGEPLQEALEDALDRSQTFAIFISSGTLGPWQNVEMRNALKVRFRDKKRRVIPVLLPGDYEPVKELSGFLLQHVWIDFRSGLDNSEAFQLLICGIKGIPLTPSTVRPAYTAPPASSPATSLPSEAKSDFFHERVLAEVEARLGQSSKDVCVLGLPGSGASTTLKRLEDRRTDVRVIDSHAFSKHEDLKPLLPSAGVVAVLGYPGVQWLAKLKALVDPKRVKIVAASAVAPEFMERVLMMPLGDDDLVAMLGEI